ncbi:hypothetical protein 043JT007_52 [Bacillus phage 043JT007]|nr:hypothetical protein 043JT007_52 [Bacillus phage 043JT007]
MLTPSNKVTATIEVVKYRKEVPLYMAWFGGDKEMQEKLFQRLLKAGRKSFVVEAHADRMIEYAKSRGVELHKSKINFLHVLDVKK